ncbi:hypothetical protein K435DRAFT_791197 [Dendrothele bispora CBS 962.96]|uniref:Zinc knuckle domain-containing protein n=1 Tax=Dendrothele bispora (strain CBS 962.96) TaxID=1314807 RepID=A0A4S8MN08_DENBC|nr:hypothetical protein K435DRAFT_791197 [Dendrothele bispora CBS 962.96]
MSINDFETLAMDIFINAGSRGPTSAVFTLFEVPNTPTRKGGKRQYNTKPYKMTDVDAKFREDLNAWRIQTELEVGLEDDFFKSQIILPDGVRDRIVDLFHYDQLKEAATLAEQTKWNEAHTFGQAIIAVVQKYKPPPPPETPAPTVLSTPFTSTPINTPIPNVSTIPITPTPAMRKRGLYGCTTCRAMGKTRTDHTAANKKSCPYYGQKENIKSTTQSKTNSTPKSSASATPPKLIELGQELKRESGIILPLF